MDRPGRDGRVLVPAVAAVTLLLCAAVCAQAITGTVRRPDGSPAEGARVRLFYLHDASGFGCGWVGGETATGAHGTFALPRPSLAGAPVVMIGPPRRTLYCVATLEGLAPAVAECAPGPWPIQLALQQARTVRIHVLDAGEVSVGGATVSVHRVTAGLDSMDVSNERLAPLYRTLHRTRADKNGAATLKGVPRLALGLTAQHVKAGVGYGSLSAHRTEGRVMLNGPPAVRATVVPPEGVPMPACVAVDLKGLAAGGVCWTRVGGDGSFVLLSEAAGLTPWASMQPKDDRVLVALLETAREPRVGAVVASVDAGTRTARIALPPGRRVEGIVSHMAGTPLPDAVVSARIGDGDAAFTFRRTTDAHGRFAFRLPQGTPAALTVEAAPHGHVIAKAGKPRTIPAEGDALNADLTARTLQTVHLCVRATVGDTPAAGALVAVRQPARRPLVAVTDAAGRAVVGPLLRGGPAAVLVDSADGTRAAHELLAGADVREAKQLQVALAPHIGGIIQLRNKAGEAVPGNVTVSLPADGTETPIARVTAATPREAERGLPVSGLLRGKTYRIKAESPKLDPQEREWAIPPRGKLPPLRVTLAGAPQEAAPAARAPVEKTKEARAAFERRRTALKDIAWKREDPHEKGQTWYALPQGIAVVNENRLDVRRFTKLFGYDKLTPQAIAFDEKSVYVGTDRGLLAYSRATLGWTRLAVGGIFIERPVTALATGGGMVRVTITAPRGESMTFEYNPDDGGWLKRD